MDADVICKSPLRLHQVSIVYLHHDFSGGALPLRLPRVVQAEGETKLRLNFISSLHEYQMTGVLQPIIIIMHFDDPLVKRIM